MYFFFNLTFFFIVLAKTLEIYLVQSIQLGILSILEEYQ